MARILVIDDSKFQRRQIAKMVESGGHQTMMAENGAIALETIAAHPDIDCILTDLLMPTMNGIELLQELKKQNCQIPIIVMSADTQTTSQQKCAELGARQFIRKPPIKDTLLEALNSALAEKKTSAS